MSGDYPVSSFGDPNAQPPTPKETPTSASFPSPQLATPRLNQGAFGEPEQGSWTPRFAEEYSVFNTTPGNLRGSRGPFEDFAVLTQGSHKRLLSSDSTLGGYTPYLAQFSPNPNGPSPPSPQLLKTPKSHPNLSGPLPSPNPSLQATGVNADSQGHCQGPEYTQTATPPPTSNKNRKKIIPKPKMQQDRQDYAQPDYLATSQQQDLNALLMSPSDMFSYPMSAPVTAPDNFWDPSSLALPMDIDFGNSNFFQPEAPSGHRHTGSFDWNNEVHLFQDLPAPTPAIAPQNNPQAPAKKARTIAPKPAVAEQLTAPVTINSQVGNNGLHMGPGAVDAGILFGRPQTAAADTSFNAMNDAGSAEAALANAGQAAGSIRRSNSSISFREARNGKMPDRTFASSPVKPSLARPGLSRSQSERGRKGLMRGTAANPSTSFRAAPQARNGAGTEPIKPIVRTSGRVSPLKKQHRMSLASIPESAARSGPGAAVKFYIGADGRARAEAAQSATALSSRARRPGSNSSADGQPWDDDEYDSSSSDDEPIIIPSRNNSFNASFALPDPRRPVGSIFHSSRRSISDRSTSTLATSEAANNVTNNDGGSDAETVMNDVGDHDSPDAANELLRVKENRHPGQSSFSTIKAQRQFGLSGGGMQQHSISPTRTEFGNTVEEPGVRCVCHRNEMNGFLIQCESCEMWQHGQCVNQRSQPMVYICAFCANTPNMRGGRLRGSNRAIGLDLSVGSSPLASKSFRSLR